MFKSKKIAGFYLFFTLLGSTAVFAQAQQVPQQKQQQKVEVSDSELSKFANAFQGLRMINQEAQQEMSKVVQEKGMDIQRFNEIHQASINPDAEVEASEEEKKLHQEIASELQTLQVDIQKKMEDVISEQGLSIERYEEIAMGLQNDPELQERLKEVFEG